MSGAISTPTTPSPTSSDSSPTDILFLSQPSDWQAVVDSFLVVTQEFIGANDVYGTWADLLSLAFQNGWNTGWERGGVKVGRQEAMKEQPPPLVAREFADARMQTDPLPIVFGRR
ncbi:hypothetical protein C8R44DRAFT_887397 [Mycena epipterygia]|nr:hypothetical protein C8R44DRAFT_887397 [Mycena epipterygia]